MPKRISIAALAESFLIMETMLLLAELIRLPMLPVVSMMKATSTLLMSFVMIHLKDTSEAFFAEDGIETGFASYCPPGRNRVFVSTSKV